MNVRGRASGAQPGRLIAALLALSLLLTAVTPAFAQQRPPTPVPMLVPAENPQTTVEAIPQRMRDRTSAAGLPEYGTPSRIPVRDRAVPATPVGDKVVGSAFAAGGDQLVNSVIYLDLPSPARLRSGGVSAATLDQQSAEIAAAQSRLEAAVLAQGGKVVYRFTHLSSGLAVRIPARAAAELAALPGVVRISQVHNYEKDLSSTVPFIGAEFLQDLGVTGAGVKVAVIDSGVDFTHLGLGGPGTFAAYDEAYFGSDPACDRNVDHDPDCAYAKTPDPALFGPAAPKVKGGYDWLGEAWTGGSNSPAPLPDPNPIDWEGHGTHVADIIAGVGFTAGTNEDGAYPANGPGVAPDAEIYAYKACASFTGACEGLALLASIDSAVGAGVDIINMSLGSNYGQPEDDLTFFSNEAVTAGVIVVASAGNSADKPFIVGSPSIADGVISVAQTTVPSAARYPLAYASSATSGTITSAVFQNWSVEPGVVAISGTLAYGNADSSNLNGCAAYTDDMTGKVVLADRGVCTFTTKARNASQAGAVLSIIGLIAPGDPFEGGDGGERPIDIPSFMISQADANVLKAQIANAVTVGLDPANAINLAYSMVGSSSRGPRNHDNMIKPDIGAPGASVSALVGLGTQVGPFGGTSGAAPMVSGVAALIKEVYGDTLSPQQVKALLMNSANLEIWQGDPGGQLAAITRIGGGQVDATAAYSSTLIAWDSTEVDNPLKWTGSLSFGYLPAPAYQAVTRTLTIQNLAESETTVDIEAFFRYAEDEGAGVRMTPGQAQVTIAATGIVTVPVVLEIFPIGDPDATPALDPLHPWIIQKGSLGASGDALTFQEVDGIIELRPTSGDPSHVVWHVLPKAVADTIVTAVEDEASAASTFAASAVITNSSPGITGTTDVFDLVAVSPNLYNYTIGDCAGLDMAPGCNTSPVDIHEVGVRAYTFGGDDWLEFAVTIHDAPYRAGQFPVEFDIYIDSDNDGQDDFIIFNADLTLNGGDGRQVVFVYELATDDLFPAYFVDSTFNTQNFILPMDMATIGVSMGQPFSFKVFAYDAYFTGALTDCAPYGNCQSAGVNEVFVYTPGKQRFVVAEDDQILSVPPAGSTTLAWTEPVDGATDSPAQIGLLFLHRFAPIGRESDHLRTAPLDLRLPIISRQPTP